MAINYTKTTWVNDSTPALNATNLNHIESGIEAACNNVVSVGTTLTAWNTQINAGSATPAVTLPAPDTSINQEITYIFTAASANASFTAPASWIVCDENGTSGLSAANTLAYTDLTTGSIYECSFKPVSASVIRLVMVETKTA